MLPVETTWLGVTLPHAMIRPADVELVEAMNQPLIVVSDGAEKLPVEITMSTLFWNTEGEVAVGSVQVAVVLAICCWKSVELAPAIRPVSEIR